ncbi:MAG: LysE family transporter [Pseudomonadota bacterium]
MMVEILTIFTGIVLAQVAPGPNMMAVAAASLGTGRAAGVSTALGVASGVLVWATLFALGVDAVVRTVPEAVTLMRFVGGGYLLWLAWRALRAAAAPRSATRIATAPAEPLAAAYRRGLLVVMTNPKAALMWIAISMFLAASEPTPQAFLLIGFGASLTAMLIYGAYALLFSAGPLTRAYDRFFRLVEVGFGAVFGVLGGKLVIDGVRELRG